MGAGAVRSPQLDKEGMLRLLAELSEKSSRFSVAAGRVRGWALRRRRQRTRLVLAEAVAEAATAEAAAEAAINRASLESGDF